MIALRITLEKDLGRSRKRNFLVTGGSGQIGSELKSLKSSDKINLIFPSSSLMDISKRKSIANYLEKKNISFVINLAAFTDVNGAEDKKRECYKINSKGVEYLSIETALRDIPIIHFSTDYVFGNKPSGIKKTNDVCLPLNYYGFTKLEGENFILRNNRKGYVVRLASVFGKNGDNFVKNITRLIYLQKDLKIVSDQKISMTSSQDVAQNIYYLIDLIEEKIESNTNDRILHFANKGYTNWFKVSKVILNEIEKFNNKKNFIKLESIKSDDWEASAKRPIDSRLKVNYKELEKKNIILPNWEKRVREVVKSLIPIYNGEKFEQ